MLTYTQASKVSARHTMFFYAIELLTTKRNISSCVERSYVRKVRDYFLSLQESKEREEALKIDLQYIKNWEMLYDSCVGTKRPDELVVCYLSGPEPQNDFDELISLGINPHNIWAFEIDQNTYSSALTNYSNEYPQPKIIKQSIEQFFVHTPKKFDIVYIDACGTIASDQHCLRIIATLCKNHRLNSPGIIVTNFACPDLSKEEVLEEYSELVAQYLFFKENPNEPLTSIIPPLDNKSYLNFKELVKSNFKYYYGELITHSLVDIAALTVPIQRVVNSNFINNIVNKDYLSKERILQDLSLEKMNLIQNSSMFKYLYFNELLKIEKLQNKRIKEFTKGFSGIEDLPKSIFESMQIYTQIKTERAYLKNDLIEMKEQFETDIDAYQFLDKPNSNMLVDVIINQLAYPLHYNSKAIRRFKYRAKQTDMFMDIIVLDECRYIYEWLPSLHQIKHALSNISWQYIFRFAIDGLVKQRLKYNTDYFYQGSVISKKVPGFESNEISEREQIE